MKLTLIALLAFVLGVASGFFSGRNATFYGQPGKVIIDRVDMSTEFAQHQVLGSVVGFSCIKSAGQADTDAECFIAYYAK
jgi:hypothetical protein